MEAKYNLEVLMDYIVRGALMCPVFESDIGLHYFVDTIDADMFLRVNGWS